MKKTSTKPKNETKQTYDRLHVYACTKTQMIENHLSFYLNNLLL